MTRQLIWDYRFMQLSETVASWSKDPSTKVGSAIIDSERRVISLGYNGFPRGVDDNADRYYDKPTKYAFVCHAERNALDNSPGSVEGATLYATLFPCNECCKSIIQRGIREVVTFAPQYEKSLLHNHNIGITMLTEAQVKVRYVVQEDYDRWKNGNDERKFGITPEVEHL